MKTKMIIKKWMFANFNAFVDPETGEANSTLMAEAACDAFADYDGDDIPDVYFDSSVEVIEQRLIREH